MNSLSLSFGVGLPSHLEGVLCFVCWIKLLSCNWKKKKKFSPPPPAQCYRSFRWVAQQVEQYDKSFVSLAPDYSLSWLLLLLARLPENDKGHDDSDHAWWVKINPSSVGNFTARPISSAQLNQILLGHRSVGWVGAGQFCWYRPGSVGLSLVVRDESYTGCSISVSLSVMSDSLWPHGL